LSPDAIRRLDRPARRRRLGATASVAFLAASFGIALLLAACGGRSAGRPPIVLISIDTLRSDHLPAYGYSAVSTPAIDALRADGLLFRSAFSHVPLTLPSHVSILSGRLPEAHHVPDNAGYRVPDSLAPWLPSLATERGYATGAFVSAFVLRHQTGFSRGWSHFDDEMAMPQSAPMGGVSRPGQATLDRAIDWLRGVKDQPFLLFVHLYEPHFPYAPPAPFAARYSTVPYDGEIAESDRLVGELLAELRRLGLYERAAVVLLSDHGEGLDDHGEPEHGVLLYREALQVPLLVKLPDERRRGETIDRPAGLVDVLPTLAGWMGAPLPADLPGSSLLDLPTDRELRAESIYGLLHYGWHPLQSVIARGHQLIAGSELELFDLQADPGETRDLFASNRRLANELRAKLPPLSTPLETPSPETEEERRKLAALGYLSSSTVDTANDYSQLPSPRSEIGVLALKRDAGDALRRGDAAKAASLLAAAVARNPRMTEIWSLLGTTRSAGGDWAGARKAYDRAFELSGRNPIHAPGLARAMFETGAIDDGVRLLRWALDAGLDDGGVVASAGRRLFALGRRDAALELLHAAEAGPTAPAAKAVLAQTMASEGRAAEALTLAREAAAAAPLDADVQEQLAFACMTAGDWPAARTAAQRAVELDARRPFSWNYLGVARYQLGELEPALDAWREALKLAPDLFDAEFNFGLVAAQVGRRDEAAAALRHFLARAPQARYGGDFARVRAILAELGENSR